LLKNAKQDFEDYEVELKEKSPYHFISPPSTEDEKIKLMEQVE